MFGPFQPPIFNAALAKPTIYTCVRLYFEDGSTAGGVWTGKEWWCNGRHVVPKCWQLFGKDDSAADRANPVAGKETP